MTSSTPRKKQRISDFFKPYINRTVPAKRSSPSTVATEQTKSPSPDLEITRVVASPRTDRRANSPDVEITRVVTTPKSRRPRADEKLRTPKAPSFSPLTAPGSGAQSIPFRSPRPKEPIQSPLTSKRPSLLSADSRRSSPSPTPAKRTTFANAPTSTHAVFRNGEVIAIRDSDDDDTASLDSLESLSGLFGKKKNGNVTSRSSSPEVDDEMLEAERVKTLSAFTRGRSIPLVGKDKLRALHARQKATNFDISGIIGDHFDDQGIEEKVRQSRTDYEASKGPSERGDILGLDRKLLATVATNDEDGRDGVSRLMDAVERTEALSADRVFLFFGADGLNEWKDEVPVQYEFPDDAIPEDLWRVGDDDSRSRAFKSGYMADLASKGRLSDKALTWAFDSVVLERQEDLANAYIECIRNSSASWTRNNVTAQDVQTVFQTLGADVSNFQDAVTIHANYRVASEPGRRDPKYLLAALDLFRSICQDMDFLAFSKLTSLLCRLAIDAELMSDGRVSVKVEEMLESLLNLSDPDMRSHIFERMIADVGHHLKDATLQAHLLGHILPVSPAAIKARLILAQTFFLGAESLKEGNRLPETGYLEILTQHVSKSLFFSPKRHRDPKNIDYTALRALTHVLDAAIAYAGRPADFESRTEEVAFNKSVDRMAEAVRSTLVSIIDTGASHLSRTEAKAALQSLYWRLLFSVRTEPRPKKNIFDPKTGQLRDTMEVRSEERSKNILQRFLKKEGTQMERGTDEGPVDPDKNMSCLGSSEPSESERLIRKQLGLSE
ncbi:hypothetical protein LTR67_006841 [Exophiala xenobiotica]